MKVIKIPKGEGPTLPEPTKQILRTGAAVQGYFARTDRWDHPAEAIAELFDIDLGEATARYFAWIDWMGLCGGIFLQWCEERGFIGLGYTSRGEGGEPTFYVQEKS